MNHLILTTAVYQDGALKLLDPPRELMDGDRVEVAVVRVVPVDKNHPDEVARAAADRERRLKWLRDRIAAGEAAAAAAGPFDEKAYEEACRAFDEGRPEGQKHFPPELRGITW